MSIQDPIGNMLTIIRNGQIAKKHNIIVSYSKIKESIIKILFNEGYIKKYNLFKINNFKKILIYLKYFLNKPVISEIKRVSKPSLRIYYNYKNLPIIYSGLGVLIISTSLGLLTNKEAYRLKVGGEIICYIF